MLTLIVSYIIAIIIRTIAHTIKLFLFIHILLINLINLIVLIA